MAERAERPCAAVLGAGAGARACAADLALHGWRVRLWELPRFGGNIASLTEEPSLALSGVVEAEVELDSAGVDLGHASDGASLIVVVTQALAHGEVAARLAEVIADDQLLFINPGSTGGALEFARILRHRRGSAPIIAETATLTQAARVRGERGVFIGRRVKLVKTAALPAPETERVVGMLKPVFPGLEPAQNVLETMLSNGNPVIHPAIMLSNAAQVERAGGDWEFYREGVTPAVADLIRAVDEERLVLGRAMGLDLLPEPEMSLRQGYAESADYLECYRDGPGFQGLGAPASLQHRYLLEDVGCGLVTMLELGEVFGVELPTMTAIVEVASVLLGRDLRTESWRGLEALGLAGMRPQEIIGYCRGGIKCDWSNWDQRWRRLPGSDLPEKLYKAVSSAFLRWSEEFLIGGTEDLNLDPLPVDKDAGKVWGGEPAPPLWNGRVYFSLWYVWEWRRKFTPRLDDFLDAISVPIEPDKFSWAWVHASALTSDLEDLRNDWYDCAAYVAMFRRRADDALGGVGVEADEDRQEWRRGKSQLPSLDDELGERHMEDERAAEIATALAAAELSDTEAATQLAAHLARTECLIHFSSGLIEQLATVDASDGTPDDLRELYQLLRDLELAMSEIVARSLSLHDAWASVEMKAYELHDEMCSK